MLRDSARVAMEYIGIESERGGKRERYKANQNLFLCDTQARIYAFVFVYVNIRMVLFSKTSQ